MRRPPLAFLLAALLVLPAFDWPGRAEALSAAMGGAHPERRRELLRQASRSSDPAAQALLVAALDDESVAVRLEAAALVTRGRVSLAAPRLTQWLDDPNPSLRLAATRSLAALRVGGSLGALTRMLSDADVAIRAEAVRAAAAVGGVDATVALLDRLSDPEAAVRVETARVLGELGDHRAVFTLLGALQDASNEVRAGAARALGRLGDPRALRGLVALTSDPALEVRVAAVRALGALGRVASEAVADLAAFALREGRESEPGGQARLASEAVEALGRVGTDAACDVLVEVIRRGAESPDREPVRRAFRTLALAGDRARARIPALVSSTPAELDGALVELLATVGGDDAARALLRYLERRGMQPSSRFHAVVALGRTGSALALLPLFVEVERSPSGGRAAPLPGCPRPRLDAGALEGLSALAARAGTLGPDALDLVVALRHRAAGGCPSQSAQVISLLGRTGNDRAPRVLRDSLSAPLDRLRRAAAEAVARAGVAGIEVPVAGLLSDPSPGVRLAAADALARHGGADALAALLDRWRSVEPLDRVSAARAMGRVLGRIAATPRSEEALSDMVACARSAPAAISAACVDALVEASARGDAAPALDALLGLLSVGGERALPALEALTNVVVVTEDPSRGSALVARIDAALALTSLQSDRVRALRARVETSPQGVLGALARGSPSVAANAIGALRRSGAPLHEEVSRALWEALRVRRHEAVLVNAALALSRGSSAGTDVGVALDILAHHPGARVRLAAARLSRALVARASGEPERARVAAALERCAADDPAERVRDACGAPEAAAQGLASIDARVVDAQGEPSAFADYALERPDGWIRVGTTGPDGWLHERDATAGTFVVLDLSELSGD